MYRALGKPASGCPPGYASVVKAATCATPASQDIRDKGVAASDVIADIAAPRHRRVMFTFRPSRPDEGERIIEIWREAVDATHHFLSSEDRIAIDQEVCGFLPQAPLWLVVDQDNRPIAFMLIEHGHMEALFVDPAFHGQGIGAALLRHGLTMHPGMTTDVNEQNDQAVGFYERMGFYRTGRSPLDGQGKPYPLIHLAYRD
jgi:putative acetyltransferase